MSSSLDNLELCRLCLVKDEVSVPIFGDENDIRQIFLKITACLPVKVSREDKLPKKICEGCAYKVDMLYQFWNTTVDAEKQLLQWLDDVGSLEDKQSYVTEVLETNVMKQERISDSRLDGSIMQVSEHQNNMDMGMMDNMSLISMSGSEQQFTSVPMDTSGTVQTVQAVAGPSTQTHNQMTQSQTHLVEEEEESEEEDNSDDGCDNEEGLPVKEETEDQNDRPLEPTTFVSLPCDEAGPSGLQQQKISEMSEIQMQQTTDGDPKTGRNTRWSRKQSIISRIRVRTALELTESDSIKEEQTTSKTATKAMPKKSLNPTSKRKRSAPSKVAKEDSVVEQENETSVAEPSWKSAKLEVTTLASEFQESLTEIKKESVEPLLYKKLKGGGFGCKACHQKFSHRYKVKQHIKMKHAPREIFKCTECSKTFKSKYQFNMHSNQHRENSSDYLFCCDKCDYRAKSKHYLKTHEIRKHTDDYNFECDHCGKRFKMKMDLKFHLGTHGTSQHMCDACGRMYTSQDSLYKHRRVVHLNDYKFQCEICHQKLLTQETLNSHMESHKNLHSCDQCDLKFTKKYYVTRHKKRVHKVEKTNLCPVCGKAFVCMATLRVHYLTHAKVKPYLCNVCGFSFTQRSSMMLHWKRKHPDAEDPPPPVILTNFFDAIQSEVNKMVEKNNESNETSNTSTVSHWPGVTAV